MGGFQERILPFSMLKYLCESKKFNNFALRQITLLHNTGLPQSDITNDTNQAVKPTQYRQIFLRTTTSYLNNL